MVNKCRSATKIVSILWQLSRPRFHIYLLGPWLVGSIAAGSPSLFSSLRWWMLSFFWLWPANIYLYGINDWSDQDTDMFNDKKQGYENTLNSYIRKHLPAILLSVCLLAFALSIKLPLISLGLMLSFFALATGYSLAPIRFKARPIVDGYSNGLYILPGLIAYSWLTTNHALPSIWVLLSAWSWTVAMHTYSAIPDIEADTKAGLCTTAVWLGHRRSLWYVAGHWFITTAIVTHNDWFLGALAVIYPVTALLLLFKKQHTVTSWYRAFPYLNALFGFILFWYITLNNSSIWTVFL